MTIAGKFLPYYDYSEIPTQVAMSRTGTLVLSLDFELQWGVFERWGSIAEEYFPRTRESIPKVLDLFDRYDVAATWATVGMLFLSNWDEWVHSMPIRHPTYANSKRSSYSFGSKLRESIPAGSVFAPDLIRLIASKHRQEIGTHTYSHYYCLEPGQTLQQFEADLELAIHVGRALGITFQSLVFPRNQFNADYLRACQSMGIENVRTNPNVWYWKKPAFLEVAAKIARAVDSFIPLAAKSYRLSDVKIVNNVCLQPASRFLRPHSKLNLANQSRTQRIKSEMSYAAKHAQVYHLWWHPHNFGIAPEESILNLADILSHYQMLNGEFGMQSMTMAELGRLTRDNFEQR